MAISVELASNILKNLVGGDSSYIVPSTWYFGLCANEPASDGTISGEPTVAGYSRLAISNDSSNFNTPTYDVTEKSINVTNKVMWQMSEITGSAEPTENYFFLSSSSSGGKASMWGEFTTPRTLIVNSILTVRPNGAVFSIINLEN